MKLESIRISELFGDTTDEKRIAELASKLTAVLAIKDEVEKALKKSNPSKRAESLAGLYLLSRMADLSCGTVKRTQNGRPYIDSSSFDFSISHSEDLAICAVGSKRVGADIEKIREICNRSKLAKRYFCEPEIEYINSSADPNEAFFRIWTRKEAYLKYTGDGLTVDLKSINTLSTDLAFSEKIADFGKNRYIISIVESQ